MYENRPPITTVKQDDGSGQRYVAGHAYRYEDSSGTIYYCSQLEPDSNAWDAWKFFLNFTYTYKSGNSEVARPLSGTWPAIAPLAVNLGYPFIFWIDETNTLNYRDPAGREGIVKDGSQSPSKPGDPVAAHNRDGDMEVFWVSNNGSRDLYNVGFGCEGKLPKVSPGLPTSLGGEGKWSPNRRPVVAQNAANELELFMVGLDDQLYNMSQVSLPPAGKPTVQWPNEWVSLAGSGEGSLLCFGDPVVARNADGRLQVFVLASPYRTYEPKNRMILCHLYQYYDGNGVKKWSPLRKLGVKNIEQANAWSARKRPAVALNPNGLLEVFMVGLDDILYHTWQTEKNVRPPVGPTGDSAIWDIDWYPFGERKWPRGSNPSITRSQDGRIELFLRDSDGKYYHRWQTSKNGTGTWDWSEWEAMP
jgi:hypothetical protein